MIRCRRCGTINEADATFCRTCDAFLEWEGDPIDSADDASADSAGSAGSPSPGPPAGPADSPAGGPPPQAPRPSLPTGAPSPVAPGEPPGPRPPTRPSAADAPGRASGPRPSERPSSPDPQGASDDDEPAGRRPELTPAVPKPKPKPPRRAKVDKPKPGDRICPNCGTGNDPTRKFCRRCGSDLGEAAIEPEPAPAPRPWYRRIFVRGETEAALAAGERPESMGRRRRRLGCLPVLAIAVLMVGALAVMAYAVSDDTRRVVDGAARTVECRVMEAIAGTTAAPVVVPGEGAYGYGAFDSFSNTDWRAIRPDAAGDLDLAIVLDESRYVHRLEITPSAQEPRPRTVLVRRPGGQVIGEAELANGTDTQVVDVCRGNLRRLEFVITDTYPTGATRANVATITVVVRR